MARRAIMTAKDRFLLTTQGAKPDKLPVACGNDGMFLIPYYGSTIGEYIENTEHAAELRVRMATEFQFDSYMTTTGYIFHGCGPEIGVKWKWLDSNFPETYDWPIQTRQDLEEKFEIPDQPTGYFKKSLQVMARVNEYLGDRVFLTGRFLGPMSVAIFMRGLNNFLLDTVIDLDFYHTYMPRFVEFSKYLGRHVVSIGLACVFANNIFLTPEMIRPSFYHKDIAPYENEVIRHFAAEGKKVVGASLIDKIKPDDPEGQAEWRILYDNQYNMEGSIEEIRKALTCRVSPRPFNVSVSGPVLATWSQGEILAYLKEACDLVVNGHGLYPVISIPSIQPIDKNNVNAMADRLRAIGEFRDHYEL